ncbi:hypothetical protein Micbo1qcDRAFT_167713 [Microdochium bolleyi]|uniref:Uncharacterized protein n=1 Tax=Microdochium bolleyi TaxID=196109 RepID=A0A136IR13_9PEZI|nr:hypothetical protein Micbo1qcDRAFT_167713 [Microdochium bolleyi]
MLGQIDDELLEDFKAKFLATLCAPTGTRAPPRRHLQRSHHDPTASDLRIWAGPDNDFSRFGNRVPFERAWSAFLLLPLAAKDDRRGDGDTSAAPLSIRFAHRDYNHATDSTLRQAAEAIHKAWPNATAGQHKRHVKLWRHAPTQTRRLMLDHISAMEPVISWLASQDLLLGESAEAHFLTLSPNGNANILRGDRQLIFKRAGIDTPWKSDVELEPNPAAIGPRWGQFWSFEPSEVGVISFPIIVATMILTHLPNKQGIEPETLKEYPDADLSWCFDFLHAHCRLEGPNANERHGILDIQDWSLETYGDPWLCMHFTMHGFGRLSDSTPQEHPPAAGLRRSRRRIHTRYAGTFREWRTTIAVRLATARDSHGRAAESPLPAEDCNLVGFTLDDGAPEQWGWRDGDWSDETLVCPDEARGVAVFQRVLWQKFPWWHRPWKFMLSLVRADMDIDDEQLAGDDETFDNLMHDDDASTKSKRYFTIIKLMKTFRKHLAVTPRDLANMREHWTRTFPGHASDTPTRFSQSTQQAINQNWDNLEAHLAELHKDLVDTTREIEAEARESWRDLTSMMRHDNVGVTTQSG